LSFGSFAAALCISLVLFLPFLHPLVIYILLFAFGVLSAVEILNYVYAMEISPRKFSATAIATTNMIVVFGGAFSQPIVGYFLDAHWSHGLSATGTRIYTASDFQHAFIILPITLILSGVLSLLLKKRRTPISA
jgi:MFS family permease